MSFIIENIRLKELAIIAQTNKSFFEHFVKFIKSRDYASLHEFVRDNNSEKATAAIAAYLSAPLPADCCLYDGIARPYAPDKAKWLLLGWVFRDAPEQRLKPMLGSVPGRTLNERRAHLFNQLREYVKDVFPEHERWEWECISEVIIDRLEGSRRSIKGTLFEAIVRRNLVALFSDKNMPLLVSETEVRVGGETYDVRVIGSKGQILMPVKTRETMGGGHALLFTRDIHKSIAVAHESGFDCLPIVIAESWGGDLASLKCNHSIYIDKNPNQVVEVEPILKARIYEHVDLFADLV